MSVAYAIVAIVLSLALLGSAAGKLTKHPKVAGTLTTVGVPEARWPMLAGLEVAGAVGLIIGLWAPALGVAAEARALRIPPRVARAPSLPPGTAA